MSNLSYAPFTPADTRESAAELAIRVLDAFNELQGALPLETLLRRDEPLARRTTLRVGGPADIYVEPDSEHALRTVLEICAQTGVRIY